MRGEHERGNVRVRLRKMVLDPEQSCTMEFSHNRNMRGNERTLAQQPALNNTCTNIVLHEREWSDRVHTFEEERRAGTEHITRASVIGSAPEDASPEMAEYFLPSVAELRKGGRGSNRGGEGRGGNREQQSYPVGAVCRGVCHGNSSHLTPRSGRAVRRAKLYHATRFVGALGIFLASHKKLCPPRTGKKEQGRKTG